MTDDEIIARLRTARLYRILERLGWHKGVTAKLIANQRAREREA